MGYIQFDEKGDTEIKFDVKGDELRKHCTDRSEYHKTRQEFFAQQEKNFENEVQTFQASLPTGGISSGSIMTGTIQTNKERMASQKMQHEDRKRYFRFCAGHLMQETYRLTEQQARTLELIA